jgi:hypothetical protein
MLKINARTGLPFVDSRKFGLKKGADRGIDGRLYFHDDREAGKTKQIILSVKAGAATVAHLRDLRGVVDREAAAIGVLLCLDEPTRPMRTEAASAGFYSSPWGTKHARLQVLTIEDLLSGRRVDYPPSRHVNVTFKKAPKQKGKRQDYADLFEEAGPRKVAEKPDEPGDDDE